MATQAQRKATEKYKKKNIKRVALEMQTEYFEKVLKPEIDKAGDTVNGWIKKAIAEKIERERK